MNMCVQDYSLVAAHRPPFGVNEITATVARYFGVTRCELKSKDRRKKVVRPRQVAMYLAYEFFIQFHRRSYPDVGRYFDGRDHSTVIHAVRVMKDFLERGDERIAPAIEELRGHFLQIMREALELPEDDPDAPLAATLAELKRDEVVELPNAARREATSSAEVEIATLIQIPVPHIREHVSEFYQVPVTCAENPSCAEELHCRQVIEYFDRHFNSGPPTVGYQQILRQKQKDPLIRADLELMYANLRSPDHPPHFR